METNLNKSKQIYTNLNKFSYFQNFVWIYLDLFRFVPICSQMASWRCSESFGDKSQHMQTNLNKSDQISNFQNFVWICLDLLKFDSILFPNGFPEVFRVIWEQFSKFEQIWSNFQIFKILFRFAPICSQMASWRCFESFGNKSE